mgnify:CR=1 FL=1
MTNFGVNFFLADNLDLGVAFERGDQFRVSFALKGFFARDTIKKPRPKNVIKLSDEQAENVKKGASKSAISVHNFGAGADFQIKIDGKNEVILADEISPDTCRLWDVVSEKKLDKDRFRKDLGNIIQAYQEVARRLGIIHEETNISEVKFGKPKAVDLKN